MSDTPETRRYGGACKQCRSKKRKCEPSSGTQCRLCEKIGEDCEFTGKRLSRARVNSTDPGIPVMEGRSPHIRHAQPHRRQSFRRFSASPKTPSGTQTPSSVSGRRQPDPSGENHFEMAEVAQFASIAEASDNGSVTNPIQPSNEYANAILDFTRRVCRGDPNQCQPDEVLLRIYFTWQQPQYMPVDESLFRRDMSRRPYGPYFSPALLYAIQAQASRHSSTPDEGNDLADRAMSIILASLTSPPSVPIAQALLILAGRDLAVGRTSAGWMKSGMAFRMIQDMDIGRQLSDGGDWLPEDQRMKQRLFWSAFVWDKFFALTLGRQPSFPLPVDLKLKYPLRVFPVKAKAHPAVTSSSKLWQPIWSTGTHDFYEPQPSMEEETFKANCLLYQEIELLIVNLYQPGRRIYTEEDVIFADRLSTRLLHWRAAVSGQVLLDTAYLPTVCPPPHIFSLNVLYRVVWILLRRPFCGKRAFPGIAPAAQQVCVSRSVEINSLFKLHSATFGLQNLTYLIAYMAYVSATVDLTEALSGESGRSGPAQERLSLTLQVLTKASRHTPGIQRSISHLRKKLQAPRGARIESSFVSGAATPTTAHPASAANIPSVDNVTTALLEAQQALGSVAPAPPPPPEVAMDSVLGIGFDDLFASLLPEYSSEMALFPDFGSSTAYLPMGDWTWPDGE